MKFSEMPYQRPDVEKLKKEFHEIAAGIAAATSAQEQIDFYEKSVRMGVQATTMESIAYVRNTINTKD